VGRVWQSDRFQHPTQAIAAGYAAMVAAGTGVLSLPAATEDGQRADLIDALFTATSAVCLTGLVTVDTGGFWSPFGEVAILVLIQAGGLGIMTLATLVTVRVTRALSMRGRLVAQTETKSGGAGDLRRLLRNIVLFSLVSEVVVAVVLTARFAVTYDEPFGRAVYHGVFHAVSAFNNAGFSLNDDNLMRYVTDPVVCLSVALAVIVGGLGFPVVFELARCWRRPREWTVLTRLTVWLTVPLLAVGTALFTAVEATNRHTFGPLSGAGKVLAGFFHTVMTRSGGFNSVDTGRLRPESLFATDVFMFIGGGSAGTAGGIKVTTFGLLAFVLWSEMRGEPQVNVGRRRVPETNQRQALAIALLGIGAVTVSTFALLSLTGYSLDRVLFEAVSAFGINGMSTGITSDLPAPATLLLVALMFVGRLGPLTLATALALRERTRRFEHPEERTIVG
ncbi:TrkH family potassium uptake protein, partial [Virgisporangium ochraceum]|uniref:TrkH family potassium uptake protein n=1 Tax=Virgisporangium ochraceum TaxID=65505 RepID=UPI0027DA09BC